MRLSQLRSGRKLHGLTSQPVQLLLFSVAEIDEGRPCQVSSQCVKFAFCDVSLGGICQCDKNHVAKQGRCEGDVHSRFSAYTSVPVVVSLLLDTVTLLLLLLMMIAFM